MGLNWGQGSGWNSGTPGMFPNWLQVDFNGVETIDKVIVHSLQDSATSPVEPVGTAPNSFDLYSGYAGMAAGRTVTGVPINGSPIYVRLMSWVTSMGAWQTRDYVYPTGTQ